MALSGNLSTGEYQGRSISFQWTATQNVNTNQSIISWKVVATGSYASGIRVHEIMAKINGEVVYHTDNYGQNVSAGTVIASGTWTQGHSADGTGSFNVYIGAGIYYQWAINTDNSASFTLDTIARASYVSISDEGLYLGDTAKIQVLSIASYNFTHTIKYKWGSIEGTIASGVKAASSSVAYSWFIDWTPPAEEFAKYIPNSNVGYGTITCETYNGSTKIGSRSITFVGLIKDSCIPTLASSSCVLDNSTSSILESLDIALAGYTKLLVSATATGALSSTITGYRITGGLEATISGSSLTDYLTSAITSSGEVTFNIAAVDSRGHVSEPKSYTFTILPYSKPAMIYIVAARKTSDVTKITVNLAWSYSDGDGKLDYDAVLEYRQVGTTNWTECNLSSKITNWSAFKLSETFDELLSYEFRITVTDAMGNSTSATTTVSNRDVFIDYRAGGAGLGIGTLAPSDDHVEINSKWTVNVHGSEILDLIKAQIVSYAPIIIEDISRTPTSATSWFIVTRKSGYHLASVYSIRNDDSNRVTAFSKRTDQDAYTVFLSSNMSAGTAYSFKCIWVKE